jgi:hypothetical protein
MASFTRPFFAGTLLAATVYYAASTRFHEDTHQLRAHLHSAARDAAVVLGGEVHVFNIIRVQ